MPDGSHCLQPDKWPILVYHTFNHGASQPLYTFLGFESVMDMVFCGLLAWLITVPIAEARPYQYITVYCDRPRVSA